MRPDRRLMKNRYVDRIVEVLPDMLPDTPEIRRIRRHLLSHIDAMLR